MNVRTGIGTDVHRLVPGRPMTVAGLTVPDEPVGPEGHSDGDVVAHAACDALLGAAGLGDLGSNYGTASREWSAAGGVAFLAETVRRVRAAGCEIGNVAVQLIGNRPKLGPRRAEAEAVLTAAVGAPVTLSGTTTDGLGPHRPRRGHRRHRRPPCRPPHPDCADAGPSEVPQRTWLAGGREGVAGADGAVAEPASAPVHAASGPGRGCRRRRGRRSTVSSPTAL